MPRWVRGKPNGPCAFASRAMVADVALPSMQTDTMMRTLDDRIRVARTAIELAVRVGRPVRRNG